GHDESKVINNGIPEDRWYRRLVRLGTVDQLPVVTFTSHIDFEFGEPSNFYLQTIVSGLFESGHSDVSSEQLVEYLTRTAKKDPEEVRRLVDSQE
ncbi:hypothetical protein OAU93_02260, partial [bacterium]|nr:hypothetical protein [bacterium]